MDVSSLKIKIDTSDAISAKKNLDNLNGGVKKLDTSVMGMSRSLVSLPAIFSGIIASLSTRELIKYADTYTNIESKLKLATKSTQEYTKAQRELFKISQETRTGLDSTVELYRKLSTSTESLNISQTRLLNITETINKAGIVGGGSKESINAALIQLGQGLASGALRGEELNSVLEQTPRLAKLIADGMGVQVGALRSLAEQGKITNEVIVKAVEDGAGKIENEYGTMSMTVEQSMTVMNNSILATVGSLDEVTGASSSLSDAIKNIAESLENNKDSIVNFGEFSYATIDRTIDIFNYLWEVIENGGQNTMNGLQLISNGIMQTVLEPIVTMSKALSKIGVVNQKDVKVLEGYYNQFGENINQTIKDINENNKEMSDAMAEIGDDVVTRVSKMRAEREKNNEVAKKEAETAKLSKKEVEDRLRAEKLALKSKEEQLKLEKSFNKELSDLVRKNESDRLDGLAKESLTTFNYYDSLILKYADVAGAEAALRELQANAMDVIIEKQNELDQAYNNQTALDSLDEIYGRYEKLIDAQIELAENGMNIDFDFGDGAKELNNISKAIQQLHVSSLKYTKQDMKLQEDYAKAYLEAGDDTLKQAQLKADFDADYVKLTEARQSAEINGYAALAGAMSSAFSEGSSAAQAFQAIQATLGIVNSFTAIAQAWASAPFPLNMPAVALTTAQMLPLIGTLTSLGGSSGSSGGGGVPISSTGKTYEANRQDIESEYTPITDRLDRQTEILESIDRNGSASKIGVANASATFERDIRLWIEDVLEGSLRTGQFRTSEVYTASEQINRDFLEGLTTAGGTTMTLNESVLRYGDNLINTISELSTNYDKFLGNLLYWDDRLEAGGWWESDTVESAVVAGAIQDISEYQDILSEWTLGIIDSMNELKEASEDFKDSYDAITGSMYYENKRLVDAFSDIEKIIGSRTLDQYLKENIEGIEILDVALMGSIDSLFGERLPASLEKYVDANATVFDTLLSQNVADIEAQTTILAELSMQTGIVFEGGAEEALNYIESIELVAEAMANSRENIEYFLNGLLTSEEQTQKLADTIGVELATSAEELAYLFRQLAYDADGLTDTELDLLKANKDLLENTDDYQAEIDSLNESLNKTTTSISTLNGVLQTLDTTIEKLRSASRTSEQNLQVFYDAMAEAQSLAGTELYESYADAVRRASTTSSALFEAGNFTTANDMKFAQLVAANQFEELADYTKTEIDYLEEIADNTEAQIATITSAMDNLAVSINESLLSYINAGASSLNASVATATEAATGATAASAEGITSETSTTAGSTSESTAATSITSATAQSRSDFVSKLFNIGMGRPPSADEFNYWVNESTARIDSLKMIFNDLYPDFSLANASSFAVGTPYVPYDMPANIHAGEIIVPKTFSDGLRSGDLVLGQNGELVDTVKLLVQENKDMKNLLIKIASDGNRSLSTQRATLDILSA